MTYSTFSQYYVPRHKKDLLTALLPSWEGSKTDLRQMSIRRLRAVFHTTRQKQLRELMKK